MTPLSRRDRAAMQLAYEHTRSSWTGFNLSDVEKRELMPFQAENALFLGGDFAQSIGLLFYETHRGWDPYGNLLDWRLLRARFALLLRVLLRADAPRASCEMCGDAAPPGGYLRDTCPRCDGAGEIVGFKCDEVCPLCEGRCEIDSAIYMRPLWESAPSTRGKQ